MDSRAVGPHRHLPRVVRAECVIRDGAVTPVEPPRLLLASQRFLLVLQTDLCPLERVLDRVPRVPPPCERRSIEVGQLFTPMSKLRQRYRLRRPSITLCSSADKLLMTWMSAAPISSRAASVHSGTGR